MSVALLVHSTAASAELLAKEVIETKEQDITKIRVSGMGQGLSWANGMLTRRSSAPLYCQPSQLAMPPEKDIAILEETIQREPRLADEPVAFAFC
jgi:hypothetical protein